MDKWYAIWYVVYFNEDDYIETFDLLNRTYTTTKDIDNADLHDEYNAKNIAKEFNAKYKEVSVEVR